jgi:hypothetical protein
MVKALIALVVVVLVVVAAVVVLVITDSKPGPQRAGNASLVAR